LKEFFLIMRKTPFPRSMRQHNTCGWRAVTTRAMRLLLASVLSLTALLGVTIIASPVSNAAPTLQGGGREPGGNLSNPVVRRVDIAAPAVVRLATVYTAHITLSLCGANVTLPTRGSGYVLGGLGSGAFISAHGDILTAGHVVDIAHADLDPIIFQSPQSAQDIANAIDSATCLGVSVNALEVENGAVQELGIPYATSYSAPRRYAWRDTSYTGPITSSPEDSADELTSLFKAQTLDVTPIAVSDFNHDDVAIVHVPLDDTPSITLDDASNVQVLDPLTVIGFPGNGDATNDPTNLLTPSVNTATVSAIKRNDDGAELIQVGGNIEHGDSGGPALDSGGHIVGVVSFGGDDTQGITAFLRSSNSAMPLITSNGISMAPGIFERHWEQAFNDYASNAPGHWHKAAQELDALAREYPDFKGVSAYRVYADVAAAHETLPATGAPSAIFGVLAGVIGLLIVVVLAVVAFLLLRRRQPRVVAPAMATATQNAPGLMVGQRPPVPVPYGSSGYNNPGGYGSYPGYMPYPPLQAYPYPTPGYPPAPGYPQGAAPATGNITSPAPYPSGNAPTAMAAAPAPVSAQSPGGASVFSAEASNGSPAANAAPTTPAYRGYPQRLAVVPPTPAVTAPDSTQGAQPASQGTPGSLAITPTPPFTPTPDGREAAGG